MGYQNYVLKRWDSSVIKNKFEFPLDIHSDIAKRYADTVIFPEIRGFIHDVAVSKGFTYKHIDVSSVFTAMDTLMDLVVKDDVDVTTVLFDFELHVENNILYVDHAFITEVPLEERTRLEQTAQEHIQIPQDPTAHRMQKLFDSLYEIFGELFEDSRLEFNHRLLTIGMRTFLDIHHDFLDAAFVPRSDDLAPLYDAFVMMLQPELDNYWFFQHPCGIVSADLASLLRAHIKFTAVEENGNAIVFKVSEPACS